MKRIWMVFMMLALVASTIAVPAANGVGYAQGSEGKEKVDLIVQSSGSIEALVEQIEALGGTVNLVYKNVPAVAISLPGEQLGALTEAPGVTWVEKDRLISLDDSSSNSKISPAGNYGRRSPAGASALKVNDSTGVKVKPIDPRTLLRQPSPLGYTNYLYTGAGDIWPETRYGKGSVVAVVDTGTVANHCLQYALTGAPGFPDGFNATEDGIPANSPENNWHGTFVGGVIASSCSMDFSAYPPDPLYLAISAYLPYPVNFVPVFGQAPSAKIYPVKVFDVTGEETPTSVVLKGLDHLLTLKKENLLDIDIVNLSFGGPTVYDGRGALDRFLREMTRARMLVVASAGNAGPIPNSIGTPGTSASAISVGALDYAISSRIFYEYVGLTLGPDGKVYNGDERPGMSLVMRPTDETRVANYSSRGPLSDGRAGPDISALGIWNFQVGPLNELFWADSASLGAPAVSGVAALLDAYWERRPGHLTNPRLLRGALLLGANPGLVGPAWQDVADQGYGALDAPAALQRLKARDEMEDHPRKSGKLKANILGNPIRRKTEVYESEKITLGAGESFNAVFEIGRATSKVTIEVYDIVAPNNSSLAFLPNALEVHVQSAKRTDTSHPVYVYWYPYRYGDAFTITIEDGSWTLAGLPWANQPMEPGLMKISLSGDYSNQAPVSFKMRVIRENFLRKPGKPAAKKTIAMGDLFSVPVQIAPGTRSVTFDLRWNRNWSRFPTSDIDMLVYPPDSNLAFLDGATLNAPERVFIPDPQPGLWLVRIQGYELYRPDTVRLYVKTD